MTYLLAIDGEGDVIGSPLHLVNVPVLFGVEGWFGVLIFELVVTGSRSWMQILS